MFAQDTALKLFLGIAGTLLAVLDFMILGGWLS